MRLCVCVRISKSVNTNHSYFFNLRHMSVLSTLIKIGNSENGITFTTYISTYRYCNIPTPSHSHTSMWPNCRNVDIYYLYCEKIKKCCRRMLARARLKLNGTRTPKLQFTIAQKHSHCLKYLVSRTWYGNCLVSKFQTTFQFPPSFLKNLFDGLNLNWMFMSNISSTNQFLSCGDNLTIFLIMKSFCNNFNNLTDVLYFESQLSANYHQSEILH